MNRTVTVMDKDGTPAFSLLRGHHLTETFNEAFRTEGWDDAPSWEDEDISHEYWIEENEGKWICSNKYHPRAVPVTVAAWFPNSVVLPARRKIH